MAKKNSHSLKFSSQEKQRQIICQLQVTYSKGTDLQVNLLIANEGDLAAQAKAKNKKLEREVDKLVGHLLDKWSIQAEQIIVEGRKRNQKLQRMIREIEKQIDTANKAVKAIGLIDDAIEVAKDILKGFA